MKWVWLQNSLRAILSLIAATAATCWLWTATPGKRADILRQSLATSKTALSETFSQRYTAWLHQVSAHGLGVSDQWEVSVLWLVGKAALTTLSLSLGASLLLALFTFLVGRLAFHNGAVSRPILDFALGALASVPLYLLLLFALCLGGKLWLGFSSVFLALFLCALAGLPALSVVWIASLDRFRSQPSYYTARSLGCSEARIYWKHAFHYAWRECRETWKQFFFNCAVGSVLFETSLGISGVGSLAWDSWRYRDFPVVMGLALFFFLLHQLFDQGSDLWPQRT